MIRPGRAGLPAPSPPPAGAAASSTSKVEQRSRARAASLLASTDRTGVSGAKQTRSTVSSKVATTLCHRPSEPGRGTRTRRPRSTPSSAAAANPSAGRPTTAHQCPRDDVPASNESNKLVNPGTRFAAAEVGRDTPQVEPSSVSDPGAGPVAGSVAGPSRTVPPLGSPPPGNSPASSGRTGSNRSAGNKPGAGRARGPGAGRGRGAGRGPGTASPAAGRAPSSIGASARACVAMVRSIRTYVRSAKGDVRQFDLDQSIRLSVQIVRVMTTPLRAAASALLLSEHRTACRSGSLNTGFRTHEVASGGCIRAGGHSRGWLRLLLRPRRRWRIPHRATSHLC